MLHKLVIDQIFCHHWQFQVGRHEKEISEGMLTFTIKLPLSTIQSMKLRLFEHHSNYGFSPFDLCGCRLEKIFCRRPSTRRMEDRKKNDEILPGAEQDDLNVERVRLENMELRLCIFSYN